MYASQRILMVTAVAAACGAAQADQVTAGVAKGQARQVTKSANQSKVVLPEALNIINFDSGTAPTLFQDTTALAAVGSVAFNGSSTAPLDGGAVLDQGANFNVTGYSAPNFLAFNCSASMADGGTPKLPEVVRFPSEVTAVSLRIGSGFDVGSKVKLFGIGSNGAEQKSVTLAAALQTVKFSQPLTHILMSSGACIFVVDDIKYTD